MHQDQRRARGFGARIGERALERGEVVAIVDRSRMPAVSVEASRPVFGEGEVTASGKRDPIVIVEIDQLAKL